MMFDKIISYSPSVKSRTFSVGDLIMVLNDCRYLYSSNILLGRRAQWSARVVPKAVFTNRFNKPKKHYNSSKPIRFAKRFLTPRLKKFKISTKVSARIWTK